MNYDVAIIGGGAAGLACAVRLIKSNPRLKIVIVEAGERLGKKLASTGNGQGNVTNINLSPDKYFSGDMKIVESIALSKDALNLESGLFHCILTHDALGRVYPAGRQASALVDSLMRDLRGVEVRLNTKVTNISKNLTLALSSGESIATSFAVLCAGGKAQKQYKTDGSAYALATNLGHTLTRLCPSLVQLKTDTEHIKTLKGIRADCTVTAFADGQRVADARGDVIFTDYGVSGNAIFYISAYIADKRNVTLSLNFLPFDDEQVVRDVEGRRRAGYGNGELLSGTLHNQLGRAIIRRAGSCDPQAICAAAKNFTLKVEKPLGFDYAQVTRGGIDMRGVSGELESKFVGNLFFAGEILDVDGCCGGYNLHWAFSSGCAVADAILKRL